MCDIALAPRYNTMTDSPQSDPPVLILDWKVIMEDSERRGVEGREKRCSGRGVKVAYRWCSALCHLGGASPPLYPDTGFKVPGTSSETQGEKVAEAPFSSGMAPFKDAE